MTHNIKDHSLSPYGSIFAQYYPASNYIDLCICDDGIGIHESYNKSPKFHPRNELEAIEFAINGKLLQNVAQDHCAHIELDFADVEYISRSFADQFHVEKSALATRQQKDILVTNANDQVIRMLQAVAKTQDVKDRLYEKMPVYHYTNWKSLESFLLSV